MATIENMNSTRKNIKNECLELSNKAFRKQALKNLEKAKALDRKEKIVPMGFTYNPVKPVSNPKKKFLKELDYGNN